MLHAVCSASTPVLLCRACVPACPPPQPHSHPTPCSVGLRDQRWPLRVRPAIQPHSSRLGGPGRACFCLLRPSLRCMWNLTGPHLSPSSQTAFLSCCGLALLLPRQEIGPFQKQGISPELPLLSISLDLQPLGWGGWQLPCSRDWETPRSAAGEERASSCHPSPVLGVQATFGSQGCSLGQSRWSPPQATSHTLTRPPFKAESFTALQRGTHIPPVSCSWAPSNQWAPSAQWTPCFRKPRNGY